MLATIDAVNDSTSSYGDWPVQPRGSPWCAVGGGPQVAFKSIEVLCASTGELADAFAAFRDGRSPEWWPL